MGSLCRQYRVPGKKKKKIGVVDGIVRSKVLFIGFIRY